MSRGIRVYTVPDDYALKESIPTTGADAIQLLDMVIVKPSVYSDTAKVYRYLGGSNWADITSGDLVFTDNTLIPNVTPSRKAHQDDYRSLLRYLFENTPNKFGDIYKYTHDFTDASLKFGTLYTRYLANELSFTGTAINSIKITLDSTDILKLTKTAFDIYSKSYFHNDLWCSNSITSQGNLSSLSDLSIAGQSTLNGNIIAGANLGVVGAITAGSITSVSSQAVVSNLNANFVGGGANTGHGGGINADTLDNYHASQIINMIPPEPTVVYQNNGSLRIKDLLIQWGEAEAGAVVTFPIEFDDTPYSITATMSAETAKAALNIYNQTKSRFQSFAWYAESNGGHERSGINYKFQYLAIGKKTT